MAVKRDPERLELVDALGPRDGDLDAHAARSATSATIPSSSSVMPSQARKQLERRAPRLLGQPAGAVEPVAAHVSPLVGGRVEDVVDDLEQETELGGERPVRPLGVVVEPCDVQAAADGGRDQRARLQTVQPDQALGVGLGACDVEVLAVDHAGDARRQLGDHPQPHLWRRVELLSRDPVRRRSGGRRRPGSRRPRHGRRAATGVPGAHRRRRAPAGRRGRARRCG